MKTKTQQGRTGHDLKFSSKLREIIHHLHMELFLHHQWKELLLFFFLKRKISCSALIQKRFNILDRLYIKCNILDELWCPSLTRQYVRIRMSRCSECAHGPPNIPAHEGLINRCLIRKCIWSFFTPDVFSLILILVKMTEPISPAVLSNLLHSSASPLSSFLQHDFCYPIFCLFFTLSFCLNSHSWVTLCISVCSQRTWQTRYIYITSHHLI